MRHSIVLPTAALVLVAATSGCSWFKKETGYQQPVEVRPLEVPPDIREQARTIAPPDAN